MKRAMAVLALGAFSLISLVGQKKPEWKDRAEYDLYESITKEANAQTKAAALEFAWGSVTDPVLERLIAQHAAKRRSGEAAEGLASFAEKRAARWTT